jgi:outer membrane protein assembly factor BamB
LRFLWVVGLCLPAAAGEPSRDWPCWRGPFGSGANSSGVKVVDRAEDAKLAWVSADPIPPAGWDVTTVAFSGGLNNPVVAHGRVYLTYYEMSGDVAQKGWQEQFAKDGRGRSAFKTEEEYRRRWLVGADDVVHCFDAATGRTAWRQVFKDQAINYNHRAPGLKTGPHMTPCVADGRLFATGALMALYCLDASTGAVVWQNPVPARYRKIRDDALAAEKVVDMKHDLCNVHLQCVDGILVVPQEGLTGYDAKTGKPLWNTREAGGGTGVGPVRWTSGAKTYLIQGRSCVDPATGKVLWRAEGEFDDYSVPAVSGDMMVSISGGKATKADADGEVTGGGRAPEGFRITPQGAQKLWRNDCGGMGVVGGASPVIMDGRAYVNVATSRGQPHYLVQIDLATGKETSRAEFPQVHHPVYDSVVGGDGLLFKVPSRVPRGVALFKGDAAGVKSLGVLDAKELYGWCSTGAYADGRLYFRRWTRLVCYDLRK